MCKLFQRHAKEHFNPLPRKEGDGWDAADNAQRLNFNPLPRKEGDSHPSHWGVSVSNFNPLPRKEGDWPESLCQID